MPGPAAVGWRITDTRMGTATVSATMSDQQLDYALDLMRCLPPQQIEKKLSDLIELIPHLCEDLLSSVNQILKIARDEEVGKDYLLCDCNRDGDCCTSRSKAVGIHIVDCQKAQHLLSLRMKSDGHSLPSLNLPPIIHCYPNSSCFHRDRVFFLHLGPCPCFPFSPETYKHKIHCLSASLPSHLFVTLV